MKALARLGRDGQAPTRLGRAGSRGLGQSLVEFALVLPIFLLMVLSIFDLGFLVFANSSISNAARAGARVAIVDQSPGVPQSEAIRQATALGLTPSEVDVAYACDPVEVDCLVEVTVEYEWQPILKSVLLLGRIFPEPITVSSTTRMPVERKFP